MARHRFGASTASWVVQPRDPVGDDFTVLFRPNQVFTAWDALSGGNQYPDLVDPETSEPISSVTSDPEFGFLPEFDGPDDVWILAMDPSSDGTSGQRYWLVTHDLWLSLRDHLTGDDPHGSNAYTDTQITNVVRTDAANVIVNDADQTWLDLQVNAAQVADLAVFRDAAGQRVTFLNEVGELRVIAASPSTVPYRVKQRDGTQTGNLSEWTQVDNTVLARVTADGRGRFPNLGPRFVFSIDGAVSVGSGQHRVYNDTGVDLEIRAVRASVGTAPTGADLIVDVNRTGTTIFSTQANRPTIAATANTSGKITNPDVTSLPDGDYLTVDVDQVGSTEPGQDLTIQVLAW